MQLTIWANIQCRDWPCDKISLSEFCLSRNHITHTDVVLFGPTGLCLAGNSSDFPDISLIYDTVILV